MLPVVAVGLVLITVVASLVTGQRLAETRKQLFLLERQGDQLRRRLTELAEEGREAEGQIRALTRLRDHRRDEIGDLLDDLRRRKSEGPTIHVARGLQKRAFEAAAA